MSFARTLNALRFIEEKAKTEKDWEEKVPFEKKIRGKQFDGHREATHFSKQELHDMGFDADIDTEFDEVLSHATEAELVDLAAVLGFTGMLNQVQFHASVENKGQDDSEGGFQAVAKHQKYKPVPDEPPNDTDIEESIKKVTENDKTLTELNLNNIKTLSHEQFARLSKGLNKNTNLTRLHCANTRLTNQMTEPLIEALSSNTALQYINLESNFLTAEAILLLVEATTKESSALLDLHLSNQRQRLFGVRAEMQLMQHVLANPRLRRLGLDIDSPEAKLRIGQHLTDNLDKSTRVKRSAKA